jgi:hypothetical protein
MPLARFVHFSRPLSRIAGPCEAIPAESWRCCLESFFPFNEPHPPRNRTRPRTTSPFTRDLGYFIKFQSSDLRRDPAMESTIILRKGENHFAEASQEGNLLRDISFEHYDRTKASWIAFLRSCLRRVVGPAVDDAFFKNSWREPGIQDEILVCTIHNGPRKEPVEYEYMTLEEGNKMIRYFEQRATSQTP